MTFLVMDIKDVAKSLSLQYVWIFKKVVFRASAKRRTLENSNFFSSPKAVVLMTWFVILCFFIIFETPLSKSSSKPTLKKNFFLNYENSVVEWDKGGKINARIDTPWKHSFLFLSFSYGAFKLWTTKSWFARILNGCSQCFDLWWEPTLWFASWWEWAAKMPVVFLEISWHFVNTHWSTVLTTQTPNAFLYSTITRIGQSLHVINWQIICCLQS